MEDEQAITAGRRRTNSLPVYRNNVKSIPTVSARDIFNTLKKSGEEVIIRNRKSVLPGIFKGHRSRSFSTPIPKSDIISTTNVPEDMFITPVERQSVSGGTAAFYKVVLREPMVVPGSANRTTINRYIGKDLARARDEVVFYETMLQLRHNKNPQNDDLGLNELLEYCFEYLGVLKTTAVDCNGNGCQSFPQTSEDFEMVEHNNDKELLILENLFDGCSKLRLVDLKIGSETAVAGWQGKGAVGALVQKPLDNMTNSKKEGFRMEGFDGKPSALLSHDPIIKKTVGNFKDRHSRLHLQEMTATMVLTYFLALPAYAGKYKASQKFTPTEVSEFIMFEIMTRLIRLCLVIRKVKTPQKWIGSSVALGFDCENITPERTKEGMINLQSSVIMKLLDWGRSELNTPEHHEALSAKEKRDREKYWSNYKRGLDVLAYNATRLYMHRFSNGKNWEKITFTIYDYDALSKADFMGQATVPFEKGGKMKEVKLKGKANKAGFLRYGGGSLKYSTEWYPYPKRDILTKFRGIWRIYIHRGVNLCNRDVGSKSDPFCVIQATSADGSLSFEQVTSTQENTLDPKWAEYFDIPVMADEMALDRFLKQVKLINKNDDDDTPQSLLGPPDLVFSGQKNITHEQKRQQKWEKRLDMTCETNLEDYFNETVNDALNL